MQLGGGFQVIDDDCSAEKMLGNGRIFRINLYKIDRKTNALNMLVPVVSVCRDAGPRPVPDAFRWSET